jgi:predicted ABC-type ATPase
MPAPELWIVAGPNGAGKTTAVQRRPIATLLTGVRFLNPDDRTLVKVLAAGFSDFANTPLDILNGLFIESANEVSAEIDGAIASGTPIGVETVLSSNKYQSPVEAVLERDGFFGLIYIALRDPGVAQERVAARVRRSGHGVPEEKIAQRWHRSLKCLPWFAKKSSAFWVYDNTDSNVDVPLKMVAVGQDGCLQYLAPNAFPEMKAALAAIRLATGSSP